MPHRLYFKITPSDILNIHNDLDDNGQEVFLISIEGKPTPKVDEKFLQIRTLLQEDDVPAHAANVAIAAAHEALDHALMQHIVGRHMARRV